MTEKLKDTGKCFYCEKSYSKGGMTTHVKSCKARKENIGAHDAKSKAKPKDIFHIVVEGQYNPQYWLHLEISDNKKLSDLDSFLRGIWLECCGHMSMFEIDGVNYSVSPMLEYGDRSMSIRLGSVLSDDSVFTHEYDFGSTTHLRLRVVDKRVGSPRQSIEVMARNFPPPYVCQKCNKNPASWISLYSDDENLLCRQCTDIEDEDELYESYLPLVNSPRTGECAYEGNYGLSKYDT